MHSAHLSSPHLVKAELDTLSWLLSLAVPPVRSCEFERNSRDAFYKLHWPLTVGPHRGHCQVPMGIEQTGKKLLAATEVCIGVPPLQGVLKNALSAHSLLGEF